MWVSDGVGTKNKIYYGNGALRFFERQDKYGSNLLYAFRDLKEKSHVVCAVRFRCWSNPYIYTKWYEQKRA